MGTIESKIIIFATQKKPNPNFYRNRQKLHLTLNT